MLREPLIKGDGLGSISWKSIQYKTAVNHRAPQRRLDYFEHTRIRYQLTIINERFNP